jgi:WD40 repeat protein
LCFWTLKNPTFPEKFIKTDHSITCCQFSKKDPHLIAVGDSHGNIAIYNVRGNDAKPLFDSKDLEGKHTDIIWELQWIEKKDKGEFLVSISGDGRIIEWSMKKGLEFTELKVLKRETNPNQKDVYAGADISEKKTSGMTFIVTGGLSIDFPADSNNNYFTATEDCTIHKCSTSYSEQYLDNYYGHNGPIYRVRCNPFWDSTDCPIFLSCSYDWTVKVWNAKHNVPQHTCLQIGKLREQVNDICWAPQTSSVFASVANDGRIEIWDLALNPLAPLVTWFDKDPKDTTGMTFLKHAKTVVRFTNAISPVLFTGNVCG